MHSPGEIISVCDCLVSPGPLLIEDLDEDLHGADEDRRQGLDLLEVETEALPLLGVEEVEPPGVHILAHLGEAGAEVFDELDEVLHGLDDLGDSEVVQHFLAVPADLPNLGRIEGKQHVSGALGTKKVIGIRCRYVLNPKSLASHINETIKVTN